MRYPRFSFLTLLLLPTFLIVSSFAGSVTAEGDVGKTTVAIKKLIRDGGGKNLHTQACGNTKSKSNSPSFAIVTERKYKMMLLVDRGGQVHFLDSKKRERMLFGSSHVKSFKITLNEVRDGLKKYKRSSSCFIGKRQDLDL